MVSFELLQKSFLKSGYRKIAILPLLCHPRRSSNSDKGFSLVRADFPNWRRVLLKRPPSSLWSEPVNISWFEV